MLRLMLRGKSLNLKANVPFVICYVEIFYKAFVQRESPLSHMQSVKYNFAVIYFIFHHNITIQRKFRHSPVLCGSMFVLRCSTPT
jgi:hypothetical protein